MTAHTSRHQACDFSAQLSIEASSVASPRVEPATDKYLYKNVQKKIVFKTPRVSVPTKESAKPLKIEKPQARVNSIKVPGFGYTEHMFPSNLQ